MTIRKFVAALLCVFLLAGMMPATAIAAETTAPEETVSSENIQWEGKLSQINPLYESMPGLSDRIHTATTDSTAKSVTTDTFHATAEAAAAALRAGMVNREATIVVGVQTDAYYSDRMVYDLLSLAYAHTGVPEEGDYLLWHWYSWEAYIYSSNDGVIIKYLLTYHTTAEEEAQVDAAVDALLTELNLWNATDYEKVKGVYDWICANVVYDYDGLESQTNPLIYTAYGALINRASVCQGYASLFYRLMLELGVDCRIITGTVQGGAHAWNIVKLGGLYYNVDPTFDAAYLQGNAEYRYFLVSDLNFLDHVPEVQYTVDPFLSAYPKAEFNYNSSGFCGAEGDNGENLIWVIQDDILVIYGEGTMADYMSDNAPWQQYKDDITWVYVDEGVTSIGSNAFYQMRNITDVYLPSTLNVIGNAAFFSCGQLKTIGLPERLTDIGSGAFSDSGLTEIAIPDGVTALNAMVFENCVSLSALMLGSGVAEIDASALSGCSGLEYYTVSEENAVYAAVDGVLFSKDMTTLIDYPEGKTGESYVVPESVTIIEPYGFSECGALKTIYFKGNAPKFGDDTFRSVTATVYYPAGNKTWTEEVMQDYGGTITWELSCEVHTYESVVTAPTCTEGGYTTHTCTKCGDVIVDTYTERLGHAYESVVTAPTCTERGYTTHTCTVCGDVVVDTYTECLSHAYESVVTAPTCTEGGYTTHTCRVCAGVVVDTYTERLGHAYESVVTAPTCTEGGYTTHTCRVCAGVVVDTYTEKVGHAYESVGTAPTCTENGHAVHTCTVCGHSYEEILPAAHTYTNDQDAICDVCNLVRHVDVVHPENPRTVHMFRLYDPNSGEHFYTGSADERDWLVSLGWNYEGVGFSFPVVGAPVYRLYDPATGEHLYTMDIDEVNSLILSGWNNEGIAFNSAPETEVPQYRLHNPNATRGAYHFTSSADERDWLIGLGWEYQGIGWYSCWK